MLKIKFKDKLPLLGKDLIVTDTDGISFIARLQKYEDDENDNEYILMSQFYGSSFDYHPEMKWRYLSNRSDVNNIDSKYNKILGYSDKNYLNPKNIRTVRDHHLSLQEIHGYEDALFLLYTSVPEKFKQDAIAYIKNNIICAEKMKKNVIGSKVKTLIEKLYKEAQKEL